MRPQPSDRTAVISGSSVDHSEPKAMASTTAAARKPMNSLGPPPDCWACWMPLPPSSTRNPSARPASAVSIRRS